MVLVCGCSSVDRVLASEAKGRGFDPRQPRHPANPSNQQATAKSVLWNSESNHGSQFVGEDS